jgi:hypothetical protein
VALGAAVASLNRRNDPRVAAHRLRLLRDNLDEKERQSG